MTDEQKQKLRDLLADCKATASSSYEEKDPFVGIYFEDLCEVIAKLLRSN